MLTVVVGGGGSGLVIIVASKCEVYCHPSGLPSIKFPVLILYILQPLTGFNSYQRQRPSAMATSFARI